MGAHPGGLFARDLPVDGYGEDYDFWIEARAATRRDDYDDWIRHWILEPADQAEYLDRLGDARVAALRAEGRSRRSTRPARPSTSPTSTRRRTRGSARRRSRRATSPIGSRRSGAHAVLAGAGVANLAAWLGVQLARDRGSDVQLTAEIGLWGYEPMLGDPFVLNHGNFPTATMLGDAAMVLGGLVGGAGTTTIGCLGGAQIDRRGNINSTLIPGRPVPRRQRRRQRRRVGRGRERGRRHADAGSARRTSAAT